MNIKSRLYLSAGISIFLVVVLVSIVSLSSGLITEENRKHRLLMDVYESVSELNIVTYDYLLHHEKRMKYQWNLKYKSIGKILNELAEEERLKSIREDHATLSNLFSQVTENYREKQKYIQEGASQEKIVAITGLEEILVAQLLITSHSIITDASRLAEMAHNEAMKTQRVASNLNVILMIILAIIVTSTSLLVARSISKPLNKLIRGAEVIGKGNLEHRVEIKTKDEIGDLAAAFNKMTQDLKASLDELKKEIIERKQAEEALRVTNQQLIASEQQLRVTNQQLIASEQQLRASNQQLIASEQQLRTVNQQLEANNQQLIANELALKKSETRFRSVFESDMIGTLFWDAKGEIIEANDTFLNLVGYSRDDLSSGELRWRDLTPPEYPESDSEKLQELAERGALTPFEKEYYHKDGRRIPIILGAATFPGSTISGVAFVLDITERKQAEEQIKTDLEEKNVLLQEIYHRTKNNMQIISSMLKTQSRNLENRILEENSGIEFLQETFHEIVNRIRSMSLVHQKLYQANDLSHINLSEYIKDLVTLLMISYEIQSETISLKLELEDVFVLIDSAIPLGLVLNELISNIFKHAFPNNEEGEVCVRLYKDEDETINIHLGDNGVGFPSDIDPKNINTMGLQTTFSLIKYQLKGQIRYDLENGLKWHFQFKDNLHKERV